MRYDEQILKLNEYTVAFLSETCVVITKDINSTLSFENMKPIDSNKLIRNSKSSLGLGDFYFTLRNKTIYLHIKDKKYNIDELSNLAISFEVINLKINNKFIVYKKGKNIFVSLADGDFTYLNRNNVLLKPYLGNVVYLRNLSREEVIEKCKALNKLDVPISNLILDYKVVDSSDVNGINITFQNDVSSSNPFYFLDNSLINISNTGAKPIITYGFSRNNSLNYFDVPICNNFTNLKEYLSSDLNYNKSFFSPRDVQEVTTEFVCRYAQVNIFLPIMFFDHYKAKVIELSQNSIYLSSIVKYSKLRHRLIPFLYSVFKSKRIFFKDVYKQFGNEILIADQLLISPITNEMDKSINQNFVSIDLDDVYYDIQTEEKFLSGTINDFFGIDKIPLYAKAGSIIPLAILNGNNDYEIIVYPGASNEFILHYDEYVLDDVVRHAYSTFKLSYVSNKMVLTITPNLIKELAPSVFHLSFVNIKKNSNVVVKGSEHKIDYNSDKKYVLVDILETTNLVEIEITNEYNVELDRSKEYLDVKLKQFFNRIDCDDKQRLIYKYKIRPYLHESLESIIYRIEKYIKFINKKQKKNLYKMISMYK